ncbi:hypothetical protein [Streptomyces sp. NBC_01497]|uniref:hypothetical protein n=1 Tax=Streptomyces sp. NBC_01497 TaxID=2903885 RepID=UPI002E337B37|nr:hypothetical protein [Streptomyces sp. NBC_01497]
MSWDNQQQPPMPPQGDLQQTAQWGPPLPAPPQRDYGRRPGWTLKRYVIPGAAVLFFIGVMIGTAGSGDGTTTVADSKSAPAPTVTTTATVTDRPAAKVAKAKPAPTVTVTATATKTVTAKAPAVTASGTSVPSFLGMGLQDAQDKAQAVGFYLLKSHDSTGAARFQILDRDWKVCTQNFKAGKKIPTSTLLDFGAVKLGEPCP